MTREEASIIIGNIPINGDGCYSIPEYQQAKAMAIEALEQQPCEDCISREEALMALTGDITDCTVEEYIARLREKLSKLSSVGKDINVTTNEDCISRQAVDELSKQLVHTTRDKADFLCNFWEGLQKLPSVTPKEKTEYEHDHEVIKAYNDGQAYILDKINTEIKETANKIRNIRNDNLCFFTEQDVLEIIEKYREVNE